VARDRWATFDCYGTLIDWNGGIRGQLARVFGEERADALLVRYHVLEPMLEADGTRSYREVLTEAMRGLGAPEEEEDALARSLPDWLRSRRRAAAAGSWRSSRTPTPTTSRHPWSESASRSTW
jgi:FMN phosphatase YigB (HAD superfamily)